MIQPLTGTERRSALLDVINRNLLEVDSYKVIMMATGENRAGRTRQHRLRRRRDYSRHCPERIGKFTVAWLADGPDRFDNDLGHPQAPRAELFLERALGCIRRTCQRHYSIEEFLRLAKEKQVLREGYDSSYCASMLG